MFENYLPPALFVTWQDPAGRSIYPVGRLVRRSDAMYEFAYLKAALHAQGCGFSPFLAFPDLNEVYRSAGLPPFFQNRVMSKNRPEAAAHLVQVGLDETATPERILGRTSGRRVTDPYETFAEFEPTEDPAELETWFFVRSLRYLAHPEALLELSVGQRLFCLRDVQNSVDPSAVALRTVSNALVGFCPAYLAEDLATLLHVPNAVVVSVERVNPEPAPLQYRLQCHLRIRPESGFHGYRSGRYEPISADALRLERWARVGHVA